MCKRAITSCLQTKLTNDVSQARDTNIVIDDVQIKDRTYNSNVQNTRVLIN